MSEHAAGPWSAAMLIDAAGTDDGWRWVFFVNLPIGVAAFRRWAHGCCPYCRWRGSDEDKFDTVRCVLLLWAPGVFALMLPLCRSRKQWIGRGECGRWCRLALALLGAFWAWERRQGCGGRAPLWTWAVSLRSFTLGA
ncbi:hypothetical protein GCM10017687_79660 [Streptomyces echinatus]|uniref:hypothetical protein n=1 Tax=Streptomyces echinatus TaxID=67293 RepID=UPI0031E8A4EC